MGEAALGGADAFTHLSAEVRAAPSERGFSTPTAPQRAAIPTLAGGEDALVVAPTGRGVGSETAARIIDNHRESEDEFYRDILQREREYARTKAFWD